MIRKNLKICCRELSFYRCEFSESCEYDDKPNNCAYDYSKKIANIDILKKDAFNEGYSIHGIEAHAVFLSENIDFDVTEQSSVTSWKKIRGKNKIRPYIMQNSSKKAHNNFQLRASELGSHCVISGLIGKLDEKYTSSFPKNILALSGTANHQLTNTQDNDNFCHNKTWERIGYEATVRSKYCENELEYNLDGIIVRGHSDALFMIGEALIVFDIKRALASAYESRARKFQLLSYGQSIGDFEQMFLITTKRAFPAEKTGMVRFPRYHLTLADNILIDELKKEIRDRFEIQSHLVNNPEMLLFEIDLHKDKKICSEGCYGRECFSKMICDDLHFKITQGERISDYFMQGVKF